MGPAMRDDGDRRLLIGGQLPLGLRAHGVSPADIDTVICTHRHADHRGWLFDHIRHGFHEADGARLHLVSQDTPVAPGVDTVMTPGHTPGHLSVVVSSGVQRALLLGDVDPDLAAQVRERLFRELEGENVVGAGAHCPELQFGRVLAGELRRWVG